MSEKAPSQELHHREVCPNDRVAIMQQIAPKFGVAVQILAKEGDTYSNQVTDRWGHKTLTGTVPKGNSFVEIVVQETICLVFGFNIFETQILLKFKFVFPKPLFQNLFCDGGGDVGSLTRAFR